MEIEGFLRRCAELGDFLMYDIGTRWPLSKCHRLVPSIISLLRPKLDKLIEEGILSEVIVIVPEIVIHFV